MLLLLATLLTSALAEEPDDTTEPIKDETATEIIVFGELLIEAARQEVITDLKRQGFTRIKEKNGITILKNETVFKGKIVLHEDGWMEHRRQGIRAELPDSKIKEAVPALGWMPCVTNPTACVRAGGVAISPRKLQHVKTRTFRAVAEDLATLSDRVADLSVDRTVNDLPQRLENCWLNGDSLMGEEHLATEGERIDDMVAFLESRAPNDWGDRVRLATRAYIRGVIQYEVGPELTKRIAAYL